MAPTDVHIGVAGCGWVAEHWHLPALMASAGVQVTAIADVDRERRHRLGERFGISSRYETIDELLEHDPLDAVAVCVPTRAHAAVGALALSAGKHVLIEKPLALTLEDCDRLLDLEARAGVVASVGFNLRWHRLVRTARAQLQRGDLGRVALAQTVFSATSRYRTGVAEWRLQRTLGGGVIADQAIHHFDLWRFLLEKEVTEVFAIAEGADEHVSVSARLEDGVLVSAAFSDGLPAVNDLAFFGSAGRLKLSCYRFDGLEFLPGDGVHGSPGDRLRGLARRARGVPRGLAATRGGGDHRRSYRAQWDAFVNAIRGRERPECTLMDGRRAVEVMLAAIESVESGRPVRPASRELVHEASA